MTKDGEAAFWLQPFVVSSTICLGPSLRLSGRRGDRWGAWRPAASL